ncbi:hypothetical protein [Nocardioides sp.]|uniref:hypothetical protein n=1 Tax=Nocardioides sp. TaxID=35761 RepID=UPI00262AC725|nr:hypothetical protein [Nocardioides sp.]MCW2737125.1 hypothetical protein [Nocardioides sp.]
MTVHTRLSLASVVLLVGAVTTACGGDGGDGAGGAGDAGDAGAPTNASEKEFCQTQSSLFEDLLPDDMADPELPTDEEMATAVQDWGTNLEQVGTPEDIPDDARKGFEVIVEGAGDVDPADFSIDQLEQLEQGGEDASAEVKKQAQAFSDYLARTCGNPLDDLDLPEMPEVPEMPDSTEGQQDP